MTNEAQTPPAIPSQPQNAQAHPQTSPNKSLLVIIVVVVFAALSGFGTYFFVNTQFEKKLNEAGAQNKSLKDQVQTLTNQVQNLEERAKEGSSSADSSTANASWVNDWIKKEESSPVANPPATLSKCTYKNQTVYYVPPRCCDIYSFLYNDKGEAICSPGGGLSGKGDGKCADFSESKNECEVIWQDPR